MKQQYYSMKELKKCNAQYNIILGERSNGKSYEVKLDALKQAIKKQDNKFIYNRRWLEDIKQKNIVQYFADIYKHIETLTNDDCNYINCHRGKIYLSKIDDDLKIKNKYHVGYVTALTSAEHYKSLQYPDTYNIVFEEFITNNYYLPNEPNILMDLVSTIFRRREGRIYLVGNTISRLCPYYSKWQLDNIPKQKQGTIEIYEHKTSQINDDGSPVIIKIAVEICGNSGNNSKLFFGTHANSIVNGTWQTEEKPSLDGKLQTDYDSLYELVFDYDNHLFLARFLSHRTNSYSIWYITSKTTKPQKDTRIISNNNYNTDLHSYGLIPLNDGEKKVFKFFKDKKIVYGDNLTGTEFEMVLKKLL